MLDRLAAAAIALALGFGAAQAQTPAHTSAYPDIADVSHASPEVAKTLQAFFVAKSTHKAADMMTHFSRDGVLYIDASSGNSWPSWESLDKIFSGMMPKAVPAALSYPVRIYGDRRSALVAFTDTPELFGKELRVLGSVSFDDKGRIIRWIDYWDGHSSVRKTAIAATYPADFHDDVGGATGRIADTAKRLQAAYAAGDAKAAAAMFSPDAVYEDMALHSQVLGRLAIERYLARVIGKAPFGPGASVAHIVGADAGGGYEWHAAPGFPQRRGNTAIELDRQGQITRLTVVYDSGLYTDEAYRAAVLLAAEN
jgi:hypothetical protein